MTDEKLLVFFTGYGSNGVNDKELVNTLAHRINAQAMFISGRYPFLNDKDRTIRHYDIVDGRHIPGILYDTAINRYSDKIGLAMRNAGVKYENVILMGRDQGAYMALKMTYMGRIWPRGVIALDGYYLNDPFFGGIKDTSAPLVWATIPNGRNLTDVSLKSPKPLIDAGVNTLQIDLEQKPSEKNMRHILWAIGKQGIR